MWRSNRLFKRALEATLLNARSDDLAELTNLINRASLIIRRPSKFQCHVSSVVLGTKTSSRTPTRLKIASLPRFAQRERIWLARSSAFFKCSSMVGLRRTTSLA